MTIRIPRWRLYLLTAVALAFAGCNVPDPGNDSIAGNAALSKEERALFDCEGCHNAENDLDPLQLNGSGVAGKHDAHVTRKNYDCEECHAAYTSASTHFNGTLDTGVPGVNLIQFGPLNPDGQWTADTGAGTGSCANVYCHGSDNTPDWYAVQALTCTGCHSSGSPIDPVATGGIGMDGQHLKHVTRLSFGCGECHAAVSTADAGHANGVGDAEILANLVNFDTTLNPNGVWSGDDGTAGTGSCDDTYCHGGTDVPGTSSQDWYTGQNLGCLACHGTSNTILDPINIDSGGVNGKHQLHLDLGTISCEACHDGYVVLTVAQQRPHIDRTIDTGLDAANDLVYMESGLTPYVNWDPAGNTCASSICHGTAIPQRDWYQ